MLNVCDIFWYGLTRTIISYYVILYKQKCGMKMSVWPTVSNIINLNFKIECMTKCR